MNGDGVADLWGETDGELRAFRGEASERWRALGYFEPAGAINRSGGISGSSEVDFDRDGVPDALISELGAPGTQEHRTTGSRTATARSGQDGHVIWKTSIDPRGNWFEPKSGDQYELRAFPPPAGDFNGDGIGDVIVKKRSGGRGYRSVQDFAIPIEAISGSNGARLWSTTVPSMDMPYIDKRSDWLEPRAIEPGGLPDLIVRRDAGAPGTLRGSRGATDELGGRPAYPMKQRLCFTPCVCASLTTSMAMAHLMPSWWFRTPRRRVRLNTR